MNLLKGSRISEAEELGHQNYQPDLCKETDFNQFKSKIPPNNWWYAMNSFRTFEGKEKKVMNNKEIENLQ